MAKFKEISKSELREIIVSELSLNWKLFIVELAQKNPEIVAQLWHWVTTAKDPLCWRSGWIFEEICVQDITVRNQYLPLIAELYPKLTNQSLKRMLGKILTISEIPEANESNILDAAFRWLHDPDEPPAVRVHAMQIAFNLTKKYPELKNELKATLEHLYDTGSKGFKNRSAKLLSKLS